MPKLLCFSLLYLPNLFGIYNGTLIDNLIYRFNLGAPALPIAAFAACSRGSISLA